MSDQVCERCGELPMTGMTEEQAKQHPAAAIQADAEFEAKIKATCDTKSPEETIEFLQSQLFKWHLLARRAQAQEVNFRGELYTLRALRDGIFRTLGFEPPK